MKYTVNVDKIDLSQHCNVSNKLNSYASDDRIILNILTRQMLSQASPEVRRSSAKRMNVKALTFEKLLRPPSISRMFMIYIYNPTYDVIID